MMRMIKKWFRNRTEAEPQPPRVTSSYLRRIVEAGDKAEKPASDEIDLEPKLQGSIESIGPGKNVYVRSQYTDEEPGADDLLEIVGGLSADAANLDGVDPYNTGRFDLSKKWDVGSKK